MIGSLCTATGWTVEYVTSLSPKQISALFSDTGKHTKTSKIDGEISGARLIDLLKRAKAGKGFRKHKDPRK